MRYLNVTHIALNVPDLRQAELYYRELFEMGVAWRDANGATYMFATWEEIEAAGAQARVALLWRDSFRLALEQSGNDGGSANGRIGHVGLQVSVQELRRLRETARRQEPAILAERDDELLTFVDRYGSQWELDTRSHEDPAAIARAVERRRAANQ